MKKKHVCIHKHTVSLIKEQVIEIAIYYVIQSNRKTMLLRHVLRQ